MLERKRHYLCVINERLIVNFNSNTSKINLLSINCLREPFQSSLDMTGTSFQENDDAPSRTKVFADKKKKDYIESIARTTAREVGSLCRGRHVFSPKSIIHLWYDDKLHRPSWVR